MRRLAWAGLALALGLLLARLPLDIGLALTIGAILAAAAVWEPAIGIGLAIVLGPAGAYIDIVRPGLLPDPGQMFFALALAGWLARGLLTRRLFVPPSWLWLPLGLYFAAGLLSLLAAQSLEEGLKEVIKWAQIAAVAAILLSEIGRGRLKWIIGALLLAGLLQALLGLWQYGIQVDGPEHFRLAGGNFRAYGSFEQPNPYGGFLGLLWPLPAGLGAAAVANAWGSRRWRQWLVAGLFGLAAVMLLGGLFASYSRGAWLGAAAAAAGFAAVLPRRWLLGVGLLAAGLSLAWGLSLAGLLPASITSRLADATSILLVEDVRGANITSENFAILERLAHWQAAEAMARDHPWLGVGIGNYGPAYARYALLNWPNALGHAHMIYLNVLAETGVIGLVTYLALWAIIGLMTLRVIRQQRGLARGLALGLLGAWIHLSVHQLVDNLYVNNIHFALGALLCLLAWLARSGSLAATQPSQASALTGSTL